MVALMTKNPDTWADLHLARFAGGAWRMGPVMSESMKYVDLAGINCIN